MNILKSSIITAAAATLLAACSGNNNTEKPAGVTPEMAADATAAATAAGGYRPDTARVYCGRADIDTASEFIVISKKELRLKVYARGKGGDTVLVARYPVCLSRALGQKHGSGDMRTPESEPGKPFTIKQIQDASDWHHDFGDGRGSILSYGHWFMRLETPFSGIGIHGSTNNEDKMPGRDSEGCIRLRDTDLLHLVANYARPGMTVIIKAETQGQLPFETHLKNTADIGRQLPMVAGSELMIEKRKDTH